MPNEIYTPVAALLSTEIGNSTVRQTCTKIMFGGYEISIAMDGGYLNGTSGAARLARTEIRVFRNDRDLTDRFFESGETVLFTSDDLLRIMKKIEENAV